jgi:hypothetical protein
MASYTFDRQALFTQTDMRELMSIISDVEMLDGDTGLLINQLYGLFDGVLYDDVLHNSNLSMLSISLVRRIADLADKIVESIVIISPETVG